MKKILLVLLALIIVIGQLSGCGNLMSNISMDSATDLGSISENTSDAPKEDFSQINGDMFTQRDFDIDYNESESVTIKLSGASAQSSSDSVKISGSTVTITQEATYVISGELADGMIVVNAEDTAKVHIVFDGVSIESKTSAALYIISADKVFLTLAKGSSNTLSNGGEFIAIDDNNIDAPVFSKQDLTINGKGSLAVSSPAGHGIVCKDDLVITSGVLDISAASHGIDANDSVRIADGDITINSGKDSIHSENNDDSEKGFVYIESGNINANAEGDCISAGAYMYIAGGTMNLVAGGGYENGSRERSEFYGGFRGGAPNDRFMPPTENTTTDENSTSMKGLKAAGNLTITSGQFSINCADDGVHSNASINISGGIFNIASGDDGVHADDSININNGSFDITQCYEGIEALHIVISGGDIKLNAIDDGINAAGGKDQSGTMGGRDGMFGGGKPGGFGGMSNNSNGTIKISGGNISITASGDGIDSNGSLEMSGGCVIIEGPTYGDTSTLDYDTTATITGGVFIGSGAAVMAQTFSDSSQGVIFESIGNMVAETEITITDSEGNVIVTHKPNLDFAVVIISAPEIQKGEKYNLSIGGNVSEVNAS